MRDTKALYDDLAETLIIANDGVVHGNLMRAPALTWGGKVFAFHNSSGKHAGMGFRLGRDYDFGSLPTKNWSHLAPFKTKPPMLDWILSPLEEAHHWPKIAEIALKRMKSN